MATTAVSAPRTETSTTLDLRSRPNWRAAKSAAMTGVMVLCVAAIAIPLVAVIGSVVSRGIGEVLRSFPDFFTSDIPVVSRRVGPGMGPAIVGTVLATGGATLLAVPLGVLGAVYLHEYGGTSGFARTVRFMTAVMAGVPSIVMGLFVYLVWTMRMGYSAFGGSLALACLMLPVVITSSEQMLKLVPQTLREASYALGASKSRTIATVVLPAALPGIVSGCLLAIARAAGETAPLMFAVGAATRLNPNLIHEANTALSLQIFENANLAFAGAQGRAWGAALTLVALAFSLTLFARLIVKRFK
jgi:phosphate transport system permease protein